METGKNTLQCSYLTDWWRHNFVILQSSLHWVTSCAINTHAGVGRAGRPVASVFCLSVCLSVCPRSKRKTAWTVNTKLGTRILYSSRSACIDPEVKMSKVKVTRLRKPSRSHGCQRRVLQRPLRARLRMSIPIRLPMFSS